MSPLHKHVATLDKMASRFFLVKEKCPGCSPNTMAVANEMTKKLQSLSPPRFVLVTKLCRGQYSQGNNVLRDNIHRGNNVPH